MKTSFFLKYYSGHNTEAHCGSKFYKVKEVSVGIKHLTNSHKSIHIVLVADCGSSGFPLLS